MKLIRLHADFCSDDKFNVVNFGDEERQQEWAKLAEEPDEMVKVWFYDDQEPLPQWWSFPIESELRVWSKERNTYVACFCL